MLLKQSIARKVRVRLEQADGTNDTGKVFNSAGLEVWLGKEGSAEAQKTLVSGDFDEIGHGYYWLKLSTTDTNTLGTLSVTVVWGGVSTGYEHEVRTVLPDDLALASDWTSARAAKVDNLDAAISTRAAAATALSTVQWTNARAALIDNLDAAVSTRAPSSTALSNVQWTNARAALVDHLDADVSSRLATSGYTAPDNADIVLIKAKTDNLPSDPADASDIATATTAIFNRLGAPVGASVSADIAAVKAVDDAVKAKTDNLPAIPASQGDVTTVGTAVAAVSTKLGTPAGASVSADIAAVEANEVAIKAKTDNLPANPASQTLLDVAVSSRLATSGYTAPDNTTIGTTATAVAAVKAKTDNLPSDPADESLIIAATDAVIARLGTPAGASVSADIAAVNVTAASAATAAAAALGASVNAMHAALGLYVRIGAPTYNTGTPDLATVRVRLYDSKANHDADDGVTGLVAPEFTRTVAYSGIALAGSAHRIAGVQGS